MKALNKYPAPRIPSSDKTAVFVGWQNCAGYCEDYRLFNLLKDIKEGDEIKHCEGSTVSCKTLKKLGVEVPEVLFKGEFV
jgi:hypothetical protein